MNEQNTRKHCNHSTHHHAYIHPQLKTDPLFDFPYIQIKDEKQATIYIDEQPNGYIQDLTSTYAMAICFQMKLVLVKCPYKRGRTDSIVPPLQKSWAYSRFRGCGFP